MSVADDISKKATDTFGSRWAVRNGTVVPDARHLTAGNDAVFFEAATVLYADLDQSTKLVQEHRWDFAGEVYKTFLYASSRLIRHHGGSIVSYDGDRVMGIFISENQRNAAVACALEINFAVKNIIQLELEKNWTNEFEVRHVVGIDSSEVRVANAGVRGDNDLVWVGNAPNLAAKLTALDADMSTWITKRVHDGLRDEQKIGSDGENIWREWRWTEHDGQTIYSTTYWRELA